MVARKKVPVRIKVYPVLSAAVESGVGYGLHRAYKYSESPGPDATSSPTREHVIEEICNAVMSELCEVIDLGDE